jgi:hypothetical protein
MNTNISIGILVPSDTTKESTTVPIGDYKDICEYVGGTIDVVTMTVAPNEFNIKDVEKFVLCGYVHDEGLLIGLDVNPRASIIFGREIVGDVVLISGTNPTSGEYDGENYDVPVWFCSLMTNGSLEAVVSQAQEIASSVTTAFQLAVEDGLFTQDEIDEIIRMMHRGPSALDADETEVIQGVMLTCLLYQKGRANGRLKKFDAEGFDMLDDGLTDDDIRRLLEGE